MYEESWKYAYQGIVPQGYLDSIPAEQWVSHIEQADVSELKKMGYNKVLLWVLEENQNARHFYEKCGLVQTEHCLYSDIGGRKLKEVQYCFQNI